MYENLIKPVPLMYDIQFGPKCHLALRVSVSRMLILLPGDGRVGCLAQGPWLPQLFQIKDLHLKYLTLAISNYILFRCTVCSHSFSILKRNETVCQQTLIYRTINDQPTMTRLQWTHTCGRAQVPWKKNRQIKNTEDGSVLNFECPWRITSAQYLFICFPPTKSPTTST